MPDLVRSALAHDRIQAILVFFNPETVNQVTDEQGNVRWTAVEPHHYRCTTFMQVTSIPKHAGVLATHALGGTSARHYDPAADR
jgi:hypothetical protein